MNFFELKKSIDSKSNIGWDHVTEKAYLPFMINRAYSMNRNFVLFANEMNLYSSIPKKWQYDFYFFGVPKGTYYDKWAKKSEDEEDVLIVSEYYHINKQRALEFLALLSKKQLDIIKERVNKGGKQ